MPKGKKAKLNELRKEVYTTKPEDEIVCPHDIFETMYYEREAYDIETAYIIQRELLDYAENEYLPLCEYMNIESVKNFLKYIFSQYSK
jgi:L-rhamnose isomerase